MSRGMRNGNWMMLLVPLFLVAGVVFAVVKSNYHEHVATCTITDKDRGGYSPDTGGQGSNYRVYTKQCGTLSNVDTLLRGKHNSGDVQGQLQEHHTYRLRIAGPRLPYWSVFPNIVAVEGEVALSGDHR